MQQPIRLFLTSVALMAVLIACTGQPHRISDQAPLLDIDSLEIGEDGLVIALAIRNLNDQAAEFSALDLRLSLEGELLAESARREAFYISARSRELLRIKTNAEPSGLDQLESLGRGEHSSLRWEATATLTDPRGRQIQIDEDGWLHAVPGHPARFR